MNNILELKGNRFIQASRVSSGGGVTMNSKKNIRCCDLVKLREKLLKIEKFWENEQRIFEGVLISVYYNKIVAKSNRIAGLLKGKLSNQAIVGAKYNKNKTKHIITYFVSDEDIKESINLLMVVEKILKDNFDDGIYKNIFDDNTNLSKIKFKKYGISMSMFKQVVADISYIDDFDVEMEQQNIKSGIITLYNVKQDMREILKKIGINIINTQFLDNQTVRLDENELSILISKASYLISMATEDLLYYDLQQDNHTFNNDIIQIPKPTDEPTIGVIDTLFDKRVYFSDWVEYHEMINENIKNADDYKHGTGVSSIIIDGPRLNPWLEDGCGRFKVRHFGIFKKNMSSFTLIKAIKEVVAENRDIKVWNISIGSNKEINDNFISAEAAILDKIQYENDVIFVISGTNKKIDEDIKKIGSPADSINSMVVNSVTSKGISPKYTRRGLALSFFSKPDVSYYGGSEDKYINVCEPLGETKVTGTSYAAPWIARKLSYLIDILGFPREVAKALIIDSARGWKEKPTADEISIYGHGIVPIHINDIIKTPEDEIKFLVSDISEKWNTYNYQFPVPIRDGKYPYIAKLTMCYFPKCERTQGVDYTNTELNLHFGRINDKKKIVDRKEDKQNEDGSYIYEKDARKIFRKWDNVKYKCESIKKNMKAKKAYQYKKWGMEIKTNNRLDPKDGEGIRFGVVVTIKAIDGVNRVHEFIRECTLNGWIVNEVNVSNRIEISRKINEEIELE